MKKVITYILLLAMCASLFAGCVDKKPKPTDPPQQTQPTANKLESARAYLFAMYKDDRDTQARRDFSMVASVMVGGETYPIQWTTDMPDYVKITAGEDNTVLIDIVEEPTEDVNFKLIGTLQDAAGNKAVVEIARFIKEVKPSGIEFAAVPAVGTAYKLAVEQNKLGQTLYFVGTVSGNYLATSTNPFEGVDVFVEEVEGGNRMYFLAEGDVKTYIEIAPRGADQPGKVKATVTTEPTGVLVWDAERRTYTTTVEGKIYYMGCYKEFNTISASEFRYIENVDVIGEDQFPAGLCTVNIVPQQVAAPAVGTPYKFTVVQNKRGETLYFTGMMSGNYMATSVNPGEGVNVYIEEAEGGVRIFFMKGETKTYIDVVPRGADQPGKVNAALTENPTCVFTWDAERKTYTTTVEGKDWYLGCYKTYNTISPSETSYIEDVSKIGEDQFPAGPYIVDGFMEMEPDFEEEEVVDFSTMTPAQIVDYAYALKEGQSAPSEATLTGVISDIPNAWSDKYGNITVVINVDGITGKPIECFRLKGDGAANLKVGDTITVKGILKNFNGKVEFDQGCTLTAVVSAE